MTRRMNEQEERLRMLEDRVKLLEQEQDKKSSTEEEEKKTEPEKKNKKRIKMQAPRIDSEDQPEPDQTDSSRLEAHALDFVPVKMARRRWETRPVLSATMDEHVTDDLNKHIEDNYKVENPPKTKSQKEMTPDHRQELIKKMLDRAGHKLGIAPLTLDHIKKK